MADMCCLGPCWIVDNSSFLDFFSMASRCFWDADTDNYTHDVFMNVSVFGNLFSLSEDVGAANQTPHY